MKIFWLVQKFGGNTPEKRVSFVGWLDGWMVQKFPITLRIEVDSRPELHEAKARSVWNYLSVTCFIVILLFALAVAE